MAAFLICAGGGDNMLFHARAFTAPRGADWPCNCKAGGAALLHRPLWEGHNRRPPQGSVHLAAGHGINKHHWAVYIRFEVTTDIQRHCLLLSFKIGQAGSATSLTSFWRAKFIFSPCQNKLRYLIMKEATYQTLYSLLLHLFAPEQGTYLSRVWEKYFSVFAMSVPEGTG